MLDIGTCCVCEVPIPEVIWVIKARYFCGEECARVWFAAYRARALLESSGEPKDALQEYREGQMSENGFGSWDAA